MSRWTKLCQSPDYPRTGIKPHIWSPTFHPFPKLPRFFKSTALSPPLSCADLVALPRRFFVVFASALAEGKGGWKDETEDPIGTKGTVCP